MAIKGPIIPPMVSPTCPLSEKSIKQKLVDVKRYGGKPIAIIKIIAIQKYIQKLLSKVVRLDLITYLHP